MPPVLRWKGYRCYFYSSDKEEPPHVHVDHSGRTAKIWLDSLTLAYNDGYPMREVNAILDVLGRHREQLLEAWHEHFDD